MRARRRRFQVAAETRAFLTERGVDLGGEQKTKTRKALEFFSKQLTRDRLTGNVAIQITVPTNSA